MAEARSSQHGQKNALETVIEYWIGDKEETAYIVVHFLCRKVLAFVLEIFMTFI